MKKYVLILVLLFNAKGVIGAINSGEQLLQKCDSYISYMGNKDIPNNTFANDMGLCIGFIEGAIYTHNTTRTGSPIWCMPGNVSIDEVIRVVVRHLRDNPDDQDKNPGSVMLLAMVQAYPCAP